MSMLTILVVVLIQIGVFQFVAVFLARSLPVFLIGQRDLPADLDRDVERFQGGAGRWRFLLGGLLAAAAVGTVAFRVGPGEGKLFLAGISVASTLAMIAGYIQDRRVIRAMEVRRPDSGLRSASLEPRTIRRYYSPVWEAVPAVVLVLSAGFTVWAVTGGSVSGGDATRMLAYLVFQGILVLGFLAFTVSRALTSSSVASRLPVLRERPEAAFALDDALRATELRYFVAAKIGIALLLGLRQVEIASRAWRHGSAPWLDGAGWALVVLLVVLFGLYIARVARLSSRLVTESR